jgi:hypothetical protein
MILAAPDFSFNLQAPYISFLVPGNVYFSNKGILDSHGVDTKERSEVTSSIFTDPNAKVVIKNLNENHINYLILNENEQLRVATPSAFTKIVFKNKEMTILQYVPETHNL